MQVNVSKAQIRRSLLIKDVFSRGSCRDIKHLEAEKGKQSISRWIYKQMSHCLTPSDKWEAEGFNEKKEEWQGIGRKVPLYHI